MTQFVCPYCYSKVDGRAPWFQCSGRGNVKCEMLVDPERFRQTGFDGVSHLVFKAPRTIFGSRRVASCPSCGSRTGTRVCPSCHTPLSVGFGRSRSPLICLAGPRASGKTVYLTVLAHRLRHQISRQFDASVTLASSAPD